MPENNEQDLFFMQQALELAVRGRPAPNPYVGAVIVKEEKIIGMGFHKKAGEAHAEVEAIFDVKKKNPKDWKSLLKGSTLYVNLEPCNHTGRTPPCTDAIIDAGIGKVVFAMKDLNAKVKGDGEKKLREAGIEVESGILEEAAQAVNSAYIKALKTSMPLLTLKMAITLDGKTATSSGDSKWISCERSRMIVMKMRDKAGAVLVGAGTVLKDNPQLTARKLEKETDAKKSKNARANESVQTDFDEMEFVSPLRVIVDSNLSVSGDEKVFFDKNALVACTQKADKKKIDKLQKKGIDVLMCPADKNGHVDLKFLLMQLQKREINQVLCEGGATLAKALLDEGLIDVMILFVAPKIIGGDGKSLFEGKGALEIANATNAEIVNVASIGTDLMVVAKIAHK
ncbi:MAG: bifunctional diaminohydroxyphosphoribosylaminopyrimidine deaminase/5-amino-6-(5-phosphoribosylamino)uracil reductase RibD [Candidatus Micrarchaeia archaeon]